MIGNLYHKYRLAFIIHRIILNCQSEIQKNFLALDG